MTGGAVLHSDRLQPSDTDGTKKGRQLRRPEDWGIERVHAELWPGPSAPRGAGGLRNPERDPNRALRQQSLVSQCSLARAWPK